MFTIWQLFTWSVFGLVVGALARLLMPGKQPIGLPLTVVLGVAGSFVGGFLWFLLGRVELGAPAGFIMSTIGAIVILFAYPKLVAQKPKQE